MAASGHVSMESQTWPRRDDRASSPGWRRALFVDAERPRATSAVGAVKKLEFLAAGGYGVPQVVSGVISIGACRLMPAGCAGGRRAMRQSRIGSNSTSQQRVARDREMNGREERETEIALGPPTTTHHRPRSRNRLYFLPTFFYFSHARLSVTQCSQTPSVKTRSIRRRIARPRSLHRTPLKVLF